MKILERKEPTAIVTCPCCGSKLEIEKRDITFQHMDDRGNTPTVICAVCLEEFNVRDYEGIDVILRASQI